MIGYTLAKDETDRPINLIWAAEREALPAAKLINKLLVG